MLLDHELVENTPESQYTEINKDQIFIGAVINNGYDERRITLNNLNNFKPSRYYFQPFKNSKKIFLYGDVYDPLGEDVFLINKLKNKKSFDLVSYNRLLQEFNYGCEESFLKLNQGIYPVDSLHINKYILDYSYEKIFNINLEICEFQQFPTIYMFVLVTEK